MEDHVVSTDWKSMNIGERICHLEVEGYVVIPDVLSPDHVTRLRAQLRAVVRTTPTKSRFTMTSNGRGVT